MSNNFPWRDLIDAVYWTIALIIIAVFVSLSGCSFTLQPPPKIYIDKPQPAEHIIIQPAPVAIVAPELPPVTPGPIVAASPVERFRAESSAATVVHAECDTPQSCETPPQVAIAGQPPLDESNLGPTVPIFPRAQIVPAEPGQIADSESDPDKPQRHFPWFIAVPIVGLGAIWGISHFLPGGLGGLPSLKQICAAAIGKRPAPPAQLSPFVVGSE